MQVSPPEAPGRAAADAVDAAGLPATSYGTRFGPAELLVHVDGPRLDVTRGDGPADLVFAAGPQIRQLISGELSPDLAVTTGVVQVLSGPDTLLKVANVSADPQPATIKLAGLAASPSAATVTTLTSASPDDENSLENPTKVSPKTSQIDVHDGALSYTFPANSVTVLRVPSKP